MGKIRGCRTAFRRRQHWISAPLVSADCVETDSTYSSPWTGGAVEAPLAGGDGAGAAVAGTACLAGAG
jgi:hypothetical protein